MTFDVPGFVLRDPQFLNGFVGEKSEPIILRPDQKMLRMNAEHVCAQFDTNVIWVMRPMKTETDADAPDEHDLVVNFDVRQYVDIASIEVTKAGVLRQKLKRQSRETRHGQAVNALIDAAQALVDGPDSGMEAGRLREELKNLLKELE